MKPLLRLSFTFSLVYFLLFNAYIFAVEFDKIKTVLFAATLETIKNSIYIFIGLFITFLGLTSSRLLFYISSFALFLIGSFCSYYIVIYGLKITPEIITVFFKNEPSDAFEMMGYKPVLWVLFSTLIWFILVSMYKNTLDTKKGIKIIPLFSFLILAIIFLSKPPYKIFKNYLPWQATNSFMLFIKNAPETKILDISNDPTLVLDTSQKDQTIVLVIGESARYDHFGINGYYRNTTPLLSQNTNLFSFYAHSCASLTYISVSCMLSLHNQQNFIMERNETSIISIFNKLGFKTSWVGTQNLSKYFTKKIGGSFYSEAQTLIIPGGSALFKLNDLDEIMLPYIKDFTNKDGNKFIIVHTSGSHWDYANRYKKDFEKFHPVCPSNSWGKRDHTDCSKQELISIYDNSIVYTDYFLNEIYEILGDKNAMVIYTSDHGESLGEDGAFGHGGSNKEQFDVPFIFWGSNKFWNNHKEMKEYLSEQKNMNLSHDNIFHTLLDCSGISSQMIDSSFSLCKVKK